jgi:hypothetical protein
MKCDHRKNAGNLQHATDHPLWRKFARKIMSIIHRITCHDISDKGFLLSQIGIRGERAGQVEIYRQCPPNILSEM